MPDEPLGHRHTAWRCRVVWENGTATAGEGRKAALAFLSEARQSARGQLPGRVVGDVQLVVSELVTNAIRHAPGPCGLQLELCPDGRAVRVAVWDTSAEAPVPRSRNALRVGGHGLEIVRALSRLVTVRRRSPGKQVTAEIEIPEPVQEESLS